MSSTGFLRWCLFLEQEEWETNKRQDFYLAQIAKEVYGLHMKARDARKLKLEPFMLKFQERTRQQSTQEDRIHRSKSFWGALTGLFKNGRDS